MNDCNNLLVSSSSITTNRYYLHTNYQGSVIALTNQSGSIVQKYEYDSFCNPYDITAGATSVTLVSVAIYTGSLHENTRLYTGREYDRETGLYFLRARYYSPTTGKFISRDPIGQNDQVNLYMYVRNNPLGFTDLFGKNGKPAIKSIDITVRFNKTLEEQGELMEHLRKYGLKVDLSLPVPHSYTREKIGEMLNNITQEQLSLIPESVLTEIEEDPLNFYYFFNKFRTGGPWDLKAHDYSDLKDYDKIIYEGDEYRYDDFGNIAYGHAGATLGISNQTMLILAGYAQLDSKRSQPEWTFEKSYFDDPRDQKLIRKGIGIYYSKQ